MNMEICDSADWYRATTLGERAALLSTPLVRPPGDGDPTVAIQIRGRADAWRSQPCFADDVAFAGRLEIEGLSGEDFHRLLGEPVESVRERLAVTPPWLARLASCRSDLSDADPRLEDLVETLNLSSEKGSMMRAAVTLAGPLLSHARHRLQEEMALLGRRSSPPPWDVEKLSTSLLRNLVRRIAWLSARTLALELNIARLDGRLEGTTASERFESFISRLGTGDAALTVLRDFPVLARQLVVAVEQWLEVGAEILGRFAADWPELRRTLFAEGDPGSLVAADDKAGDRHNGGRAVMILSFSSGGRLVYKPKSLAVEKHFQQLLDWLNDRGDHPAFRTYRVVDRGGYGWVEFVARESCRSQAEVRRFYERIGGMLAVLYVLEATDFHYENLIAAGEHPVLIDLESLFQARLGELGSSTSDALAQAALQQSVLRVGLLPNRILINARPGARGIDLSALGATPGQTTPIAVPHWEGVGTDRMHLVRKPLPLPAAQNRPSLDGGDDDRDASPELETLDYTEELVRGFESLYGLMIVHREELLGEGGPLVRFRSDPVRVILRATQTYGQLLFESLHPDVLQDALDRDPLFDRLWVSHSPCPQFGQVFHAERQDLERGDIPHFTTRVDSRDLWTSRGTRLPGFFASSGLELVEGRLKRLDEADLERQSWFLRASLTSLSERPDTRPRESRSSASSSPPDNVPERVSRERLLAAAREVGDRLDRLAHRGEGDASWIGLHLLGGQAWGLRPLALDLYGGLPGVALFLAYLGDVTEDDRYSHLARRALKGVLRQIESARGSMQSVGGFNGWGGVLYLLSHLSALWQRRDLAELALEVADTLPELIARDEIFDVIGGSAGCIGGLLSLHRVVSSEAPVDVARQGGRRLLESARSMETGIAWPSPFPSEGPLAGFSHGAAGVAWSLLELARETGETAFRQAAAEAIRYERTLFCPEAGNWRDLRLQDPSFSGQETNGDSGRKDDAAFMSAWCHGAPGIGLARLRALRHLDDPVLGDEIQTALETTLGHGFGAGDCLCHGDLGNLELLLEAGRVLEAPEWRSRAEAQMARALQRREDRGGWTCGVPLGIETPGLMTGLAGIGYGLLRMAQPERVPCLLLMEPPRMGP